MSNWRTHPADTTLILALDRELPLTQRLATDRHLLACEACRSRLDALATAARETTRVYRDGGAAEPVATDALRRRLEERMTELRAKWDESLLFRLRRAARSMPVPARVGVLVAFLAVALRLAQPSRSASVAPPASEQQALPIGHFTPGATSRVSLAGLCSGALPTRHVVPVGVRQQILRQYRMEHVAPAEYEFDYLVTPELGGVADARNLWPERYESGVWNARVKDDLERLLPRLICDGAVDLGVAQREIADNWIDAYKKYFKTERPIPRQAGLVDDDDNEILFEPAPDAPLAHSALVSVARPPLLLSATLIAYDRVSTLRGRKGAW